MVVANTACMSSNTHMRLQKAIARAGICSRRQAEQLIRDARVRVNGQVVREMGTQVDLSADEVIVDQTPLLFPRATITYMLNKPRGLLCSASSKQGATIFSHLKAPTSDRLFSIGRLDKDSEGLLLLTNDGAMANQLTHPRYQHTKTYEVQVAGNVSTHQVHTLNRPMLLDHTPTQPARVRILSQSPRYTLLEWTLREGRNRQIRRMCAQVDLRIHILRRTRIGHLPLGSLPTGCFRKLSDQDLQKAYQPTDGA